MVFGSGQGFFDPYDKILAQIAAGTPPTIAFAAPIHTHRTGLHLGMVERVVVGQSVELALGT